MKKTPCLPTTVLWLTLFLVFAGVHRGTQAYSELGLGQENLHPLDPLTESEINLTVTLIKSFRPCNCIFSYITLKEPPKSVLLPYFLNDTDPIGAYIPRHSFTVLLDRTTNRVYEVNVNLDTHFVESWNELPAGISPMYTLEEEHEIEEIAKANATVQERCERMGWTEMDMVEIDLWGMGHVEDKPEYNDPNKRLATLYFFGKKFDGDNFYANPLDFVAVVDLISRSVINIEDIPIDEYQLAGNNKAENIYGPVRESNNNQYKRDSAAMRQDLHPVKVFQEDTSFTLEGNELQWQNFKMRLGVNGREGLIIHTVNYNDSGKVRPLFYRMSMAEIFVPYGDPRSPYYRKQVYDEGQFGLGYCMNSLEANLDCVGEVRFIDAVFHNGLGQPEIYPQVVCIREEDAGILWKHTDEKTGEATLVRSQRLALTFIATFGNYDYIFTWNFYQDGTIEHNVKLTGILSLNLLAVNASTIGHGTQVAPQINAQYHQHFFSLRLDPEIDGNENSVEVKDVVAGPGEPGSVNNPYGQAFTTEKKVFQTTGDSRTNVAPEKSRAWIITNPNIKHPYTNTEVGWKLMPWPTPPLCVQKQSPIHPQVEWMEYNTWVTPYNDDQFYPAGDYLNKSGLPEWVGRNEQANIANTDVVIWHNFGVNHVPRAEDFPIMPVETIGVFIKPYNFFVENPSMDVPPPKAPTGSDPCGNGKRRKRAVCA